MEVLKKIVDFNFAKACDVNVGIELIYFYYFWTFWASDVQRTNSNKKTSKHQHFDDFTDLENGKVFSMIDLYLRDYLMTYENAENGLTQNCRKFKIGVYTKL